MKITIYIFLSLLGFVSISCGQESNKNNNSNQIGKAEYNVPIYTYDSLTIPVFFKTIITNHLHDFYLIDSSSYSDFCKSNDIVATDSTNIQKYFTIQILHDLFTSKTAANCSQGNILDIPYLWHWVNPNPRHEIYFVKTNQLLSKTKAPQEFSKYKSYADIDRTPFLFLSDLVQESPKYYSASCDTFSTFGWCSEREMAFIALTKLLHFDGKVVAEGNHSWSEFCVQMNTNKGIQHYLVRVDNTFNTVDWIKIEQKDILQWRKYLGSSTLASWYNQKANSNTELQKISNYIVGKEAMSRIEIKIVNYLETSINAR